MKRIIKILCSAVLMIFLSTAAFAQPGSPPPPPPDPSGGGGGNPPVGGGAPIGSGLIMLLVLGAAYGGRKAYLMNKEQE